MIHKRNYIRETVLRALKEIAIPDTWFQSFSFPQGRIQNIETWLFNIYWKTQ